jgi:hypothetical protein
MMDWFRKWRKRVEKRRAAARPRCPSRRVILRLEILEDRTCPAGTWVWIGAGAANGGDGQWTNTTGFDWEHNGVLAPAGQYPGMPAMPGIPASTDDVVDFNQVAIPNVPGLPPALVGQSTGPATLNVGINPLAGLSITNWLDTLTLNNSVWVQGNISNFDFTDGGSTITLGNGVSLNLQDLAGSTWSGGTITGAGLSSLNVLGTPLGISGTPGSLGTNLNIGNSPVTGANGQVWLGNMTTNLALTGANNTIDVGNGGWLNLYQTINAAGTQNTVGGIDTGIRANPLAVQVSSGGMLSRSGGGGVPGVPNQVMIGGVVYNTGGEVDVGGGNAMLNITRQDANGYSYWQNTGGSALLLIDNGSNIDAAGTYQIDIGTVQLQAPAGGSTDELDGAGLDFGNANPTALTFVDAKAGTPGTVQVQGAVDLAANTTTTMNFLNANNTADQLSVLGGTLGVAGNLNLKGDQINAEQPLPFFAAPGGNVPTITGDFASITDNLGGTDTWRVDNAPPGGTSYGYVTIS